jgi:hypothetical protein
MTTHHHQGLEKPDLRMKPRFCVLTNQEALLLQVAKDRQQSKVMAARRRRQQREVTRCVLVNVCCEMCVCLCVCVA